MTGGKHGILVGCDGSLASRGALGWASQEARERATVLTVCHAWTAGSAGPLRGLPFESGPHRCWRIRSWFAR